MNLSRVAGVYRIRNTVNGRVYIGSSINLWQRFEGHRSRFRRGVHENTTLMDDVKTYGSSAFVFEVLEVIGSDEADLIAAEDRAVAAVLDRALLYNGKLSGKMGRYPRHRRLPEGGRAAARPWGT